MRLGYFGGSFDPPHLGHLTVARAAAVSFSLDEVLFVPTGRQPLKPNGAVASFADRLAMVEILSQEPSQASPGGAAPFKFTASALERPQPGDLPNYTVDTLDHLRAQLTPTDDLFLLVGADAFLDLRRWREPDRLLALAQWIVISRPGISLQQIDALALLPAQRERVHLLEGVHDPASATEIRRLLSLGSDCKDLLPPSVLAYIRAHHLYGT